MVKNPPAMQETQVRSLGWEDPLENRQAPHSSILGLPWWLSWWERIRLQCRRPRFTPWVGKICWRREQLPTPVFLLGEFHGLYSPWGCKELDTTERLSFSSISLFVLYLNLNEVLLLLLLIYGHYSVRFTCIYLFLFLNALFLSISMFLYNYLPWA